MRSVIALLSRHRLASMLGLIVLLRAALPYALRPVLARQASQAINAHVTIGDVDLSLHRAGIALEDVAVHPVTWTPETDTGEPPLIAWKRFAVAVRWLPLFQKTVQLRELMLESPRVALDRLQDGGLNVAALAPASGEDAAPAEKSSWRFGIDRIVLRDGGVRFRDLMFERERPVELALGSFEVEDIALTPGVYGEPARLRLKANVDEGQFALDAGFTPRDDGGFVVTSRVKARRLPLRRTRVYIPKVGWSALDGEVGGVFEYTLETGGRNELRGFATVNGLAVHIPQLTEPGLAWKRLAVRVDPIDLAGHRATVKLIDLSGMYLVARARGGVVFPFLEGLLTGEPTDSGAVASAGAAPAATPPAQPEEPPAQAAPIAQPAAPIPPSPDTAADQPAADPVAQPAPTVQATVVAPPAADAVPWQWSIAVLRIYESLLHVISPDASVDAGIDLAIRRLRGDEGDASPVKLTVVIEDAPVTLEGDLRVRPLGFAGTVKAATLPLPNLLTTAGAFPPGVVQRARLDADLGLAAGVLAPTAGDARVSGSIALLEPYLTGAGGPTMELGATRIGVGIGELVVPGALPDEPATVPMDLHLSGGTLSAQDLWVVRTEPTPLDVRTAALDVSLDDLTAPGAGPVPADGGTLRLRGGITLGDLAVANPGGSGFDVALRGAGVTLGELLAPGIRATDSAVVTAPVRVAKPTLTLNEATVTNRETQRRSSGARAIQLSATDVVVPGALGGPRGDVEVRGARLAVGDPGLAEQKLAALGVSARGIDASAGTLRLPGPASDPGSPIRARDASVRVSELRANDPSAGITARARRIDLDVGDLTNAPAMLARGIRLRLVDASAAGPDAREFLVAARTFDLDADEIVLATGVPGHAKVRTITLAAPRVQLLRTPEGIRFPGPAAPPAKPAPSSTSPPPAPAQAPAQATPGFDVSIATFRLSDGRVAVVDRSVKPTFTGGLTGLQVDAADVRWPERSAGRLRIATETTQSGKVLITGSMAPAGGKLEVKATEIPLKQFSPYAAGASPYSIRRGRLTVTTKATFDRRAYDSATTIKLADFDLGGRKGDSLFKEQFGIPLSMALALLRDLNGDIKLDVPVEGDEAGMHVGYGTIISGALRSALMGAIASPLKMVGAVFSGNKLQAAPEPIGFRLGRAELTDDGAKQVGQVAKFLADRPAMGVALETAPTAADARWLHENEVVKELGAPPGVFGRVRNLVQRGRRDRIRQALDERAEGKPGELGPDDQKVLDEWLSEKPKPTPEQLHALAEARLALVDRTLREEHGVAPGKIVRREVPAAAPEDTAAPVADIELGSVADLTAPPEDDEPARARGGVTP